MKQLLSFSRAVYRVVQYSALSLGLLVACGDGESPTAKYSVAGDGTLGGDTSQSAFGGTASEIRSTAGGGRGGVNASSVETGGGGGGANSQFGTGGSSTGGSSTGGSFSIETGGSSPGGASNIGAGGSSDLSAIGCSPAACSDGNPCTEEACGSDGQCLHSVRPDGTQCEDLDPCTEQDQCLAGVCRGTPHANTAAQLGQFHAFGALDASFGVADGLAVPLSESRIVFLEPTAWGSRFVLAAVTEDGSLEVKAEYYLPNGLVETVFLSTFYRGRGTQLVRISDTRFVVAFPDYLVITYDVVGDTFEAKGAVWLGTAEEWYYSTPTGATVAGNDVWFCVRNQTTSPFVQHYRVEEDGALSLVGRVQTECKGLLAERSGGSLLVGTLNGLQRIREVSGVPTLDPNPVLPLVDKRFFLELTGKGDYVFTLARTPFDTGLPVLRKASDLSELHTFPMTSPQTTEGVFGAVFVGKDLLVQKLRFTDDKFEVSAELYSLGPSGPVLMDSWVSERVDRLSTSNETAQPVAYGRLVVLAPQRWVLWVENGHITPLTGRRQGRFQRVMPVPGGVLAFSSRSAHRLQLPLSDDSWLSGGILPHDVQRAPLFATSLTPAETSRFLPLKDSNVVEGTLLDSNGQSRRLPLEPERAVTVFGTKGQLHVLRPNTGTGATLASFPPSDVITGNASARIGPAQAFDVSDTRWLPSLEFAIGERSGDVLIADDNKIVWMERRDLQWTERCRGGVGSTVGSMVVDSEHAFAEAGGTLYRLRCEGQVLVTKAEALENVFVLLGVYGGTLYTTQSGARFDPLVSAFSATDLSPVASYDGLTSRPSDMTVSGTNLVFVGGAELTVATAECK